MSTVRQVQIGRADRLAFLTLALISIVIGLGIVILGTARTVAIAAGTATIDLTVDAPVADRAPADWRYSLASGPSDFSPVPRALLAAGEGVAALVALIVTMSVTVLFVSIAQGRPFRRVLETSALLCGLALTTGGMVAFGLQGVGHLLAADDLSQGGRVGVFVPAFVFDPTSIAAGFAVLALAYVFSAGRRMERDTEGLV